MAFCLPDTVTDGGVVVSIQLGRRSVVKRGNHLAANSFEVDNFVVKSLESSRQYITDLSKSLENLTDVCRKSSYGNDAGGDREWIHDCEAGKSAGEWGSTAPLI